MLMDAKGEHTMITVENRPSLAESKSDMAIALSGDLMQECEGASDLSEVVDNKTQGILVRACRSLPPKLCAPNLFFFVLLLHRKDGKFIVDVDIELRPGCDPTDEPHVRSLERLEVACLLDSGQIHDEAIALYRVHC